MCAEFINVHTDRQRDRQADLVNISQLFFRSSDTHPHVVTWRDDNNMDISKTHMMFRLQNTSTTAPFMKPEVNTEDVSLCDM